MSYNQPPTNDTFNRAAAFPNFTLHLGSAWQTLTPTADGQQVGQGRQAVHVGSTAPASATERAVPASYGTLNPSHLPACLPALPHLQVRIISAKGNEGLFDFLIVSTGLLTDARLRPELGACADQIATWGDSFQAPPGMQRNQLIDDHPYLVRRAGRHRPAALAPRTPPWRGAVQLLLSPSLAPAVPLSTPPYSCPAVAHPAPPLAAPASLQGPSFEFREKQPGAAPYLSGIYAFNYSALVSMGLSASALSGAYTAAARAGLRFRAGVCLKWPAAPPAGSRAGPRPRHTQAFLWAGPAIDPCCCSLPPSLAAGSKYALPKVVGGITRSLFLEDSPRILSAYLSYREEEFVGVWPRPATSALKAALKGSPNQLPPLPPNAKAAAAEAPQVFKTPSLTRMYVSTPPQ